MCASIWSVNPRSVLDFPAVFILKFMKNHSLVSVGVQRPQWLTVSERSKTYSACFCYNNLLYRLFFPPNIN